MKNSDIKDPVFREAIEAIDSGDIILLESLLARHPRLVKERLSRPSGDYFQHPYLLWFVAGNPIRVDRLPVNIVDITRLLIRFVKQEATGHVHEQLDYALGLVVTGRIPKESGSQIELADLLIDEGAKPRSGLGALAHGNIEAAEHLIKRGGELTLAIAAGLNRLNDVVKLAPSANKQERLTALAVAAYYGKPPMIAWLLSAGTNPNGYPKTNSGFHTHATPLHQAVYSGSLDSVKLLVEAGERLHAKDKVYGATPLGWAEYAPTENPSDNSVKEKFSLIANYLREWEQAELGRVQN